MMRITILPNAPRPSAVEAAKNGGGYSQLEADERGRVIGTVEYRVELVGHAPCGFTHPTWPDEAEARLGAHLRYCELEADTQ